MLSVWEMAAHLLLFVSLCVVCRVGVLSTVCVSRGVSLCVPSCACRVLWAATCDMVLDLFIGSFYEHASLKVR